MSFSFEYIGECEAGVRKKTPCRVCCEDMTIQALSKPHIN